MANQPHFSGKRQRLEGHEERSWTTLTMTTASTESSSSAFHDEDLLDQLKMLLHREVKYAREDYIGCFPDNSDLPVVPRDEESPERHLSTKSCLSAYSRRTKQSKTRKNASVNSKDSPRSSGFSEHHRARLCEWAIEGKPFVVS